MEYEVLKRKLDTYRKSNGQFKRVNGELLIELLRAWETYSGASGEFARKLGMRSKQLGSLVREARKIATSTEGIDSSFLSVQPSTETDSARVIHNGIEVVWGTDKIIRFPSVDSLMDFIKKAS